MTSLLQASQVALTVLLLVNRAYAADWVDPFAVGTRQTVKPSAKTPTPKAADPVDTVLNQARADAAPETSEEAEAREARWATVRKQQAAAAARQAEVNAAIERAKPSTPAQALTPCQTANAAASAYRLARKAAAVAHTAAIQAERRAMSRAAVLARLGHISIADARQDLITVDQEVAFAAYNTYEAAKHAALDADTARQAAADTAIACKRSR